MWREVFIGVLFSTLAYSDAAACTLATYLLFVLLLNEMPLLLSSRSLPRRPMVLRGLLRIWVFSLIIFAVALLEGFAMWLTRSAMTKMVW